jgi:glyoxylate/hydroxypyruvate reductase A
VTSAAGPPFDVVIATPLDAELAARIGEHPAVRLHYHPDLLPPSRYPNDHRGVADFVRSPEQEQQWQQMLTDAEVLYGIPGDSPEGLAAVIRDCPQLTLIQATSAGAAEQVTAANLSNADLDRVAVTTASGVHAGPLTEFAILGILRFSRDLPRIEADQAARRWDHYATADLANQHLVLLGTGAIGTQIARVAHALRMRTIGVNSHGGAASEPFDELYPASDLRHAVRQARALVVTVPLTDHTRGMVNAEILHAMPHDAIIVNVGRGPVIDEAALIDALNANQLGGAALDVTTNEPLGHDSPLWTMSNVLVSPHTAALSPRESERIVDIFLDNLTRMARGQPLINRVTHAG